MSKNIVRHNPKVSHLSQVCNFQYMKHEVMGNMLRFLIFEVHWF